MRTTLPLAEIYAQMSTQEFIKTIREYVDAKLPPDNALFAEFYKRFSRLVATTPVCTHLHSNPLLPDKPVCDVSHEHCACRGDYVRCCLIVSADDRIIENNNAIKGKTSHGN